DPGVPFTATGRTSDCRALSRLRGRRSPPWLSAIRDMLQVQRVPARNATIRASLRALLDVLSRLADRPDLPGWPVLAQRRGACVDGPRVEARGQLVRVRDRRESGGFGQGRQLADGPLARQRREARRVR